MARQRILKPGFFTNEDLGSLPPLTRLLFAGLWCWADREGRLQDRPRRLRGEILPYDPAADGEAMISDLVRLGFLRRYEADGVKVLQVAEFLTHQDPHPREAASVLPRSAQGEPKANPRLSQGAPEDDPGFSAGEPGADQGSAKVPPRRSRPSRPSRPSSPSGRGSVAAREGAPEAGLGSTQGEP
jgi:hypothetical protein